MDPRICSQHTAWSAMTGILIAVLLFQVAGSLRCYSCIEEGDSGCSPANTPVVLCVPPMNICTEYIQTISTDSFTVTRRKKGCSLGLDKDYSTVTSNDVIYHTIHIRACSTDYCNTQLPSSTVTRPTHNTTDPAIPNGMECYSCLSFSEERCSSQKTEKIKCAGDMTRCYEGNVIVSVDDDNASKPIYIKTCALNDSCTASYSLLIKHAMIRQQGSCCSGRYCNGPLSSTVSTTTTKITSKSNSQVPCSSLSRLSLMLGILIVTVVL
ncbi:ly6/PLAUR domain-containing protein 3 isoform X2 [Microcaecilia unicolor]|nr:ly6/PLAUR domain-containing protein 3-like isoform X2 [Microcaecilia unicolor]XP_030068953.1 ly6/PLAUR domain-containing protein 3-like isoform X2 [Microcaecilia unicolor]XP_030068955.1 ly6/PLAUR domain-containing protein 3-like isoform X2 [Microcaecilia unicolor]